MHHDYRNTGIVALAALLLTLVVLMFVANNPWMLFGIAAIVRAINGTFHPRDTITQRSPNPGGLGMNDAENTTVTPEVQDDTIGPDVSR